MRFIVDSSHGDFYEDIKGGLSSRMKSIAAELQRRVRAKFALTSRVHAPSLYPRKLTGQLMRSIRATPVKHAGGFIDHILIEAGVGNERKRATLFALEQGAHYPERSTGYYTIPHSYQAKLHSSKGGTARSFPEKLRFIPLRPGLAALVKDSSAKARRKGSRYSIVYWLTRSAITRYPRYGLESAFLENLDWLQAEFEREL
jgi:hypothetical protein